MTLTLYSPVDLVTSLYGGAFWGCIFTGLIATVLVGGVVFFAVWHVRCCDECLPYRLSFQSQIGSIVYFTRCFRKLDLLS